MRKHKRYLDRQNNAKSFSVCIVTDPILNFRNIVHGPGTCACIRVYIASKKATICEFLLYFQQDRLASTIVLIIT